MNLSLQHSNYYFPWHNTTQAKEKQSPLYFHTELGPNSSSGGVRMTLMKTALPKAGHALFFPNTLSCLSTDSSVPLLHLSRP